MEEEIKLYLVTLKGMTTISSSEITYGISYVIAKDAEQAYQKVKKQYDSKDIGFKVQRQLDNVKLLASTSEFSGVDNLLFFN